MSTEVETEKREEEKKEIEKKPEKRMDRRYMPGAQMLKASQRLTRDVQIQEESLNACYEKLARCTEETEDFKTVEAEIRNFKQADQNLRHAQHKVADMADELEARYKDVRTSINGKLINKNVPTNAYIDLEEKRTRHFAQGLNAYKLFLIYYIGCFAGVVVETLWCFIKNGYIESRTALVFAPLNPVYGLGALGLTVALYRYRNRSSLFSIVGGFLVGSVVEYLCSFAQEMVFGSTSWDYSHMPFNLNGRICLQYSMYWGILGLLWIKNLYPRMARWILRIPNSIGKTLCWVLLALNIFDTGISLMAVGRWSMRISGQEANTLVSRWFDEHFPDERMERIYANLEFKTAFDGEK